MSEWKTVRLGDVFDLQMGKTPERKNLDFFSTTDNKWISIADISKADKYIFETKEYISDEAVKKSGIKQIPANTVIMSFKLSIGKTAITKEPMYSNEAIMAFLPNGKYEVDNVFLYHLFSNKDWSEGSNKAVKGIILNKASLLEAKILLPSLTIQKQIAKIMDKCTEIISKNKKMLETYDTLIKSRFIEIFGDPVKNPMGWENKFGKELFSFSSGKFLDASKRMEKGIPVYGGNGIAWYTDIPLISFDTIIIGRVGAYCGNIKKVQEPVWVTDNAIYIKQFKEKCFNLYFLYELMSYMNFYQYADFSGQPKITQKPLENNKYIIPPIEKQKQFAAFVQQIDKSKFTVQKSLEKAETLYKSLMQEYFE